MTKLLDDAIAEVRKLPDSRQDEAADLLLFIAAQESADVALSPEQQTEVRRRLASPRYLSEAQASELFTRLIG